MGTLDLSPFAEKGIGFIEEKDPVFELGPAEYLFEDFLRFADELADQLGQVHPKHLPAVFAAQYTGRQRFSRSRRPVEQHPIPRFDLSAQVLVFIKQMAMLQPYSNILDLLESPGMKNQIIPSHFGADSPG